MKCANGCDKQADIEVIKTHVVYIKSSIDEIKTNIDKLDSRYATKREMNIFKGALVLIGGALGTIYWFLIGVIR